MKRPAHHLIYGLLLVFLLTSCEKKDEEAHYKQIVLGGFSPDGHSGQGELLSLADAGIVSLNLANTLKNQTLANGCGRVAVQQRGTHRRTPCGCNTLAREGSFSRADCSTSAMGEFRLAIDTFDSQFAQAIEVPEAQSGHLYRNQYFWRVAA